MYDIIGNIAILKFRKESLRSKKKIALNLLREHKNISTVLEKVEKVSGRLRTIKTRWLAGIKTKTAFYRENGCVFKFDIEKCYFSPRLASERLEIAEKCRKNDSVLVLFAGVAPFSIVIAKKSRCKVVSVELGRECHKYAVENVRLNKLSNVEIIQGDVKKLSRLLKKNEKFSKIIMPRPQLKETFLHYVWKFTKKGTEIYYYGFGDDAEQVTEEIKDSAILDKKKIKIFSVKKAGDIAPYKYRWRVDLKLV